MTNTSTVKDWQILQEMIDAEKFVEAVSFSQVLCERFPDDAKAWLMRGTACMESGNPNEAMAACRRALSLSPDDCQAMSLLGRIQHKLGNRSAAMVSFQAAIRLNSEDPTPRYNLALLLLENGDIEAARKSLNEVIHINPAHARALFLLGACHGQLGDIDASIACNKQLVNLQPDNVDAYFNLGQAYMHQHKQEEAANAYGNVLRFNPYHSVALNNLAFIYGKQGKFKQAVECRKAALKTDMNNVDMLVNLGNALHDAAMYEEAIPVYRRVLELQPDMPTVRFALAALEDTEAPDRPPSDYVSGLFDQYADTFDEALVGNLGYRTPNLLHEMLQVPVQEKGAPLDILDIGCGTGLCGPLFRDVARSLTGIDLSVKMVEKARERGVYDDLFVGDVSELVKSGSSKRYDLILSADVFPYVGNLDPVFDICATVLREDGLFALSTEAAEGGQPYLLRPSNRYAHSAGYVREVARRNGFMEIQFLETALRKDRGKTIMGYLFIFSLANRTIHGT